MPEAICMQGPQTEETTQAISNMEPRGATSPAKPHGGRSTSVCLPPKSKTKPYISCLSPPRQIQQRLPNQVHKTALSGSMVLSCAPPHAAAAFSRAPLDHSMGRRSNARGRQHSVGSSWRPLAASFLLQVQALNGALLHVQAVEHQVLPPSPLQN